MSPEEEDDQRQRLLALVEIRAVQDGGDWIVQFSSANIRARQLAYRMAMQLPAHMRSYQPASQTWKISLTGLLLMSHSWNEMADFCGQVLDEAKPITVYSSQDGHQSWAATDTPEVVARAFALLHLDPSAPPEVIQAVWRTLARRAHPDAGGDIERMKALNHAYDIARRWAMKR